MATYLRYHATWSFGYGKRIKEYTSDPGTAAKPCKISVGWFGKAPLYYISEWERDSPYSSHFVSAHEYFTGVEVNRESTLYDYHYGGSTDMAASEFEKLVNSFTEKQKIQMANQIKQLNEEAHSDYLRRKGAEERAKSIEDAAEARIQNRKIY